LEHGLNGCNGLKRILKRIRSDPSDQFYPCSIKIF
jgi:hypothetical protein